MQMIKFTEIGQFRHAIRNVCYRKEDEPVRKFPTLKFIGTVKLYGTNAGISYSKKEGIWCQSRSNIITPKNDNAGFATFIESRRDFFEAHFASMIAVLDSFARDNFIITIFGEWCGGNIQKGIAINGLEKMFVTFAIRLTDTLDPENHWYIPSDIKDHDLRIYSTYDFPTYEIEIDFNNPLESQAKIIEMVEEVEKECPVGKYFGVSGTGEGLVFANYGNQKRQYIFKAKGQKHSTSKVKKLAEVDVEKLKTINEFVEYVITENRLNQGIEQVFTVNNIEPDIKHTGLYLKWVSGDVFKEELDTLTKNGLEHKDVGKPMTTKARLWFMGYLNKIV